MDTDDSLDLDEVLSDDDVLLMRKLADGWLGPLTFDATPESMKALHSLGMVVFGVLSSDLVDKSELSSINSEPWPRKTVWYLTNHGMQAVAATAHRTIVGSENYRVRASAWMATLGEEPDLAEMGFHFVAFDRDGNRRLSGLEVDQHSNQVSLIRYGHDGETVEDHYIGTIADFFRMFQQDNGLIIAAVPGGASSPHFWRRFSQIMGGEP